MQRLFQFDAMRSAGGRRRRFWRLAALCVAAAPGLALGAPDGQSSYHVHVGDVIEIAVAGLPALHLRSNVQPDGAVSFPLVGALNVAGMTPAELRQTIQSQFRNKIYRQRAPDGREVLIVIQSDEVSAAIAEYGPIYVDGDVTKPGALTFRPGLTVREAIALAGGLGLAANRLPLNSPVQAADAKSDYQSSCVELVKAEARVARIQAELDGKDSIEDFTPDRADLPQAEIDQIRENENDILQARWVDYRREQDFLRASIGQLGQRSSVLEKRQSEEEEGARADTAELQRTIELLNRGNITAPRVLDARRALLLSQTRALQVADSVLQIKNQTAETARRLQHLDDDRKTKLLKELQDAGAEVDILKIKRDAALNKMFLLRAPGVASSAQQAVYQLVREEQTGTMRKIVDGDFRLEPGDVVEVTAKAAR